VSTIIYFNFEGNPAAFRRSQLSVTGPTTTAIAEAWLAHPRREGYAKPSRLLIGNDLSADLYEVAVTERTVEVVGPTPEFEAAAGRSS
jgi:hypothetical protein